MTEGRRAPAALSADERLEGFVRLWSEIKYNFAFFSRLPGLDWDKVLTEYLPLVREEQSNQNYYRLLSRCVAQLHDGHTLVWGEGFSFNVPLYPENALFERISRAKGLILDVRENGGGSSDIGSAIIGHLTDRPLTGSRWKTRQHLPSFSAWGQGDGWHEGGPVTVQPVEGNRPFLGPVVVLIGPGTFSAAEDFLIPLHYNHRATLVGQPTSGSTGQPLSISLPGGGTAFICTKWDTYPDGREFVGVGVMPDVKVYPTQAEIAEGLWSSGKDPILDRGLEVLRAQS